MYVPLWTCLRAPFLHFAWTSFTVLGSSYGCKTCTFPLLFLTCAFKGEDFFLKFWYVVFLESFSSNYFVTEIVVHFWRLFMSLFHKYQTAELSSRPLSVNPSWSAMRAKHTLRDLSAAMPGTPALYPAGRKVSLAPTAPPSSPISPPRHLALVHVLVFNFIWNHPVILYHDKCHISVS